MTEFSDQTWFSETFTSARPTQKLVQPLITLHPGSLGVLWVPRTLVEASSREQWRLIRLCGCADWSVFTGRPYRKIHCLFVVVVFFFFIPDNKCAVFINAWKVVMICAGQDLIHHRTHPTHDTRRHSRSQTIGNLNWEERVHGTGRERR